MAAAAKPDSNMIINRTLPILTRLFIRLLLFLNVFKAGPFDIEGPDLQIMRPDEPLFGGQPKSLTEGLESREHLPLIGVSQAKDIVGVSAFRVHAEGFNGIGLRLVELALPQADHAQAVQGLSLIHISEPTRQAEISYA